MKSIRFTGDSILENENIINEGLFGKWFGGKNAKKGFLGNILSFIPGFSGAAAGSNGSEAKDPYKDAVNDFMSRWKKRREDELKEVMQHKTDMQVQNYKNAQQAKLNAWDADKKVKQFKRKQELDAAKTIEKQLKAEARKIKQWTMGPTTPEFMAEMKRKSNEIYKNSTPAEQQLVDDAMKVITDICYDENGQFIADPKEREEIFNKMYPEDVRKKMFANPGFKEAYELYKKSCPTKQEDFDKLVASNIVNDPTLKSKDELEKDRKKLEDYLKSKQEASKSVKDIDSQIKAKEKLIKDTQTKLEEAKEAKKKLDNFGEKPSVEDMRKELKDNIINSDKLLKKVEGPNGDVSYEINKESQIYKDLKEKYKLSDGDISKLTINSTEGELNPESIGNWINDKITDETVEAEYNKQKKELEEKVGKIDSYEKAIEQNKKELNDPDDGLNAKLEKTNKIITDKNPEIEQLARQYQNIPNNGEPLTDKQLQESIDKIKQGETAYDEAQRSIDDMREDARRTREKMNADDKFNKAYNDLSKKEKDRLENLPPKFDDVEKTDETGKKYIETDVKDKDGEPVRLYKPNPDDQDYEEQMQKYDIAMQSKMATAKLGPKPEFTGDNFEEIKQWEANDRAKKAAANNAMEEIKKAGYEDEDAAEILSDKEFLKDADADFQEDEENKEEDSEEVKNADAADDEKLTQSQKDVDDAQTELDNLDKNDPDYDNKKAEAEKKLKQAKKNHDQTTQKVETSKEERNTKRNPANVWKKKVNRNTGKSTKRYYNKKGDSISAKEYHDAIENYKKNKNKPKEPEPNPKKKEPENNTKAESLKTNKSVIFENRPWKMTTLSGKQIF